MLLHVPSAALSAAGALSPERLEVQTRRVAAVGAVGGAAIVAASGPLGAATGLERSAASSPSVLAAPAAGLLGLARGVAYGRERLARVSASLVVEPAVRLAAGIALAVLIGPLGAAIGAVLSGYAALAVCAACRGSRRHSRAAPVAARAAATLGVSFVLLAVVQSVDLLVANRVLDDDEAARFAVLSTIGGAAFFATATIPLVLLPSIRQRPAELAAPTAYALTAGTGLTITAIATLLARPIVGVAFGPEYRDVASLVGRLRPGDGAARGDPPRGRPPRRRGRLDRRRRWRRRSPSPRRRSSRRWRSPGGPTSAESVVAITLFTVAALAVVVELPHVIRWRPRRRLARNRRWAASSPTSTCGLCWRPSPCASPPR